MIYDWADKRLFLCVVDSTAIFFVCFVLLHVCVSLSLSVSVCECLCMSLTNIFLSSLTQRFHQVSTSFTSSLSLQEWTTGFVSGTTPQTTTSSLTIVAVSSCQTPQTYVQSDAFVLPVIDSTRSASAKSIASSSKLLHKAVLRHFQWIKLCFVFANFWSIEISVQDDHGAVRVGILRCREYCKVTNFRPVPIFVLLTWNWFARSNFRTFESLTTKSHWNSRVSKQKEIFIQLYFFKSMKVRN